MLRNFQLILLLGLFFCLKCHADTDTGTVIWSGTINADGTPSPVVQLELGQRYQLKVSGSMNLGNWYQNHQPLRNDACYQFNDAVTPTKLTATKNSMSLSVCDGKYHADHVYVSKPFLAYQSGIHCWIDDTDYSNNSGTLQLQVIKLSPQNTSESAAEKGK